MIKILDQLKKQFQSWVNLFRKVEKESNDPFSDWVTLSYETEIRKDGYPQGYLLYILPKSRTGLDLYTQYKSQEFSIPCRRIHREECDHLFPNKPMNACLVFNTEDDLEFILAHLQTICRLI